MKTAGKLFMFIYRVLAWVLIAAAAVLTVLFIIGIRPYAVKTGSMEPAIHEGSLCFINHNTPYEELHEGQVIAFKTGEMLVTHRIVRVDPDGIVTKGDANNTTDAAKVNKENYIGKNEAVLPFLGRLPLFAQSGSGKYIMIFGFVAFLLVGLLYDKIAAWITKKEENDAAQSGDNDKDKEG